MKRYEVRSVRGGEFKEETDSLIQARSTANSMGNWNIPCSVKDRETGETVFVSAAYRDIFRPGLPETLGWDVIDGKLVFVETTPAYEHTVGTC